MRSSIIFVNACALGLISNCVIAETYQAEMDAGYKKDQYFFRDQLESMSAAGTYYFNPVEIKNHPLAEAAFLEKAGSANLSYSYTHDRFDQARFIFPVDPNEHADIFFSKSNYYVSDANVIIEQYFLDNLLYLAGGYDKNKFRIKVPAERGLPGWDQTVEISHWTAKLGLAPIDGLLVWSNFIEDQKIKDTWNINSKYVTDWIEHSINLEASYKYYKYSRNSLSIAADFYLDRSQSIGLTAAYSGKFPNYIENGARARKFFTENISVEATYSQSDIERNFGLNVAMRI